MSREVPPVVCPLEFSISSRSNRAEDPQSVRYRLVGRQLYHTRRQHFTIQLHHENAMFLYDDMLNDSCLADVGEASMLTIPTPETTFLVYTRISDHSVSFCKHSNTT